MLFIGAVLLEWWAVGGVSVTVSLCCCYWTTRLTERGCKHSMLNSCWCYGLSLSFSCICIPAAPGPLPPSSLHIGAGVGECSRSFTFLLLLVLFSCVTIFGMAVFSCNVVLGAAAISVGCGGGGGAATMGNLGVYSLGFFRVISVYMHVVENASSSKYSDRPSPFSLILRKPGISPSLFNPLMKSFEPICETRDGPVKWISGRCCRLKPSLKQGPPEDEFAPFWLYFIKLRASRPVLSFLACTRVYRSILRLISIETNFSSRNTSAYENFYNLDDVPTQLAYRSYR